MRNKLSFPLVLAATLTLTACSKLGNLTADRFTVTSQPLEAANGKVPATIATRFPAKYMKKKAVVTITPVLRYANGETAGTAATFRGENVLTNDQMVSYANGGNYMMKTSFAYRPEMASSELFLTFDAHLGKKRVQIPEVKVGYGVLATATLLERTAAETQMALGEDAFQYTKEQKQEAQIRYLIQQAKIRNSELKTTSIQDFIRTLKDIKADGKSLELSNIEVSAYASPDGGMKLNTDLAKNRESSSSNYVKQELKRLKMAGNVEAKYTAEDWEGFQQLVSQSNIQDKDIILRVLSLYPDPEERERQIRNLSAGFRELADEILPELRRARLTINYLLIGRSDDEIQAQYAADPSKLSIEELLYYATLTESKAEQENIYRTATRLYPNDYRAYNNLAIAAYERADFNAAEDWLRQAAMRKGNAAEVNANYALLSLVKGDIEGAENYLGSAAAAKNYNAVVGNLNIARGNYAQATADLKGVRSNSAALAQILNKDYVAAQETLDKVVRPTATTDYLKAILAMRMRQSSTALTHLRKAIDKDPALRSRAANDLEFSALFNDPQFKQAVK